MMLMKHDSGENGIGSANCFSMVNSGGMEAKRLVVFSESIGVREVDKRTSLEVAGRE